MSSAAIAIAGIALSAGVWLAGVRWVLVAQADAIDNIPNAWRVRAPEDYEALRSFRVGDLSRQPYLFALLAGVVGFFWLLTAAGVSSGVQVGFGVLAAVYWTSLSVAGARRESEAYRTEHGLDPVPRNRPVAWRYRGALFVACLGFTMLGFFIAQVIAGNLGVTP
jgi:hypothetical protein